MKNISEFLNESLKRRFSLFCVGDAIAHEEVCNAAHEDGRYDFRYIFEPMVEELENYDLKYYNQESIIGGGKVKGGDYEDIAMVPQEAFNSPDEFGDALIDAGFNMVSLSNNHELDNGIDGLLHSISYWDSKDVFKSGQSIDGNHIAYKEVNGIRVSFIAYTLKTNYIIIPEDKAFMVNVYSYEKAKEDLAMMKKNSDVTIVSLHSGTEGEHVIDGNQLRAACNLSSLGADIIIGGHSHTVQPIEYIGNTLVIWSLGNFIACHDVDKENKRIGLSVSLDVSFNGSDVKIESIECGLDYICYERVNDGKIEGLSVMPLRKDNIAINIKDEVDRIKSIVDSKIEGIRWKC